MANRNQKTSERKGAVLSIRLTEQQLNRLAGFGRRIGKTPSESAAILIEESLRRSEFAFIEFRDSAAGRRACLQGSSLAIWEIIMVAQGYKMNVEKTAEHFEWPIFRVQAAMNYWKAFPEDIEVLIQDNNSYDFEKVQSMLPQAAIYAIENQPRVPVVKEAGTKKTALQKNQTHRKQK